MTPEEKAKLLKDFSDKANAISDSFKEWHDKQMSGLSHSECIGIVGALVTQMATTAIMSITDTSSLDRASDWWGAVQGDICINVENLMKRELKRNVVANSSFSIMEKKDGKAEADGPDQRSRP